MDDLLSNLIQFLILPLRLIGLTILLLLLSNSLTLIIIIKLNRSRYLLAIKIDCILLSSNLLLLLLTNILLFQPILRLLYILSIRILKFTRVFINIYSFYWHQKVRLLFLLFINLFLLIYLLLLFLRLPCLISLC